MKWKQQAQQLQDEASFDIAIFLLEKQIKEDSRDIEAYIFLLYFLVNVLVENTRYWAFSQDCLRDIKKDYYGFKAPHYRRLLRSYFHESYEKFSNNPEYLFYASGILIPTYWFCGLDQLTDDFLSAMQQKAFSMNYNTILAKEWDYRKRAEYNPQDPIVLAYAKELITDCALQEQLLAKGAAAKYVFGMTLEWASNILAAADC